ncbi:MAG TPA: MFS transporter [Xanthomonadales bacterium]|nr:MFS transporter [Xanthomonadales bacterium]
MKNNIRSMIWRYYAYSFFSTMIFFSAVLIPFFTKWGGLNLFQVQLLQSWFALWLFALDVPSGVIADRIGRKYTVSLGCLIFAAALLLYGSTPSFSIFLISEFLAALGLSLISGADEAILYEVLKENGLEQESKKYFGRANSFKMAGILVGALSGSLIAGHFELNVPTLLSAIPLLIAGIIAWTFTEPKVHSKKLEKIDVIKNLKNGYVYLLRHKTLRLLALDMIVVWIAGYFVIWLYQPMLENAGVAIVYFGLFQALFVLAQIIVSHNFSFLEKVFGSAKSYLRFSAIVTGLAFILVAVIPNVLTILIFVLFAGGFGLSRRVLMSSYMNKFIPSEQRATVLSSVSTFGRLSIALVNPIVGLIATQSIQFAALFIGLLPLALFFFSPIEQEMFE